MPRIVPVSTAPKRQWVPKEAGGERRIDDRINSRPPDDGDVAGWMLAPATSHCWGFRLIDADERDADGNLTDAARRQRRMGDVGRPLFSGRGRSFIHVRFRGQDGTGIDSEYRYMLDDHRQAREIFADLCRAAHPYGSVVYPRLRQAGVAYQKVA